MDKQFFFPSTSSSSLFDTYLVYGIIGLLILIALIGLLVLLATSCCCCYCCLSPTSCCYHRRRHSSYQLAEKSKRLDNNEPKRSVFIRRFPSDAADFSQLYDSYPHLINNKATAASTTPNLNASCTTIDTMISPISPCSSFRSNIEPGALPNDQKCKNTFKEQENIFILFAFHSAFLIQADRTNTSQQNNIHVDKFTNNAPSSMKGKKKEKERRF